jgi:endogenous inhibitor of DNA gyrase (YacG/DUF329 family)
MVDLGAWFAGERSIAGEEVAEPESQPSPDSPLRD